MYEGEFVPSAPLLFLKFKVIDCPSAIRLWKAINKLFVIVVSSRFDDNLSQIFANGEDDVLVCLLQFEFLEFGDTVGANRDTGGGLQTKIVSSRNLRTM